MVLLALFELNVMPMRVKASYEIQVNKKLPVVGPVNV